MPFNPTTGYTPIGLPAEVLFALLQAGQKSPQGKAPNIGGAINGAKKALGIGGAGGAGYLASGGASPFEGASASALGNVGNAFEGAHASALGSAAGINPALLGAGFIASAPIWAPAVQKGLNSISHKLFGKPMKREFVKEEATSSKALNHQLPGFEGASPETKAAIVEMLHSGGFLNASKKRTDDTGQELEGTSWAISPQLYNDKILRTRHAVPVEGLHFVGASKDPELAIAPQRHYSDLEDVLKNPSPYLDRNSGVLDAIRKAQEMLKGGAASPGPQIPQIPKGQDIDPGFTDPSLVNFRPNPGLINLLPATFATPLRSSTSSPGISKSGQRINYSQIRKAK